MIPQFYNSREAGPESAECKVWYSKQFLKFRVRKIRRLNYALQSVGIDPRMAWNRDMIGSVGHADMLAFGNDCKPGLFECANDAFRRQVRKKH